MLGLIISVALAALVYAVGVRRMRRRWPVWRTALFFGGLFAVLLALVSGIDLLATQLFSVHMVQHMLLLVVATPLLLAGAPVRPFLRGLPIAVRRSVVHQGAIRQRTVDFLLTSGPYLHPCPRQRSGVIVQDDFLLM